MNHRENYLRAATFGSPAWIPCAMGFSPVTVTRHGAELDALMRAHPRVFPEHDPAAYDRFDCMPPAYREGELYTDNWGCVWRNIAGGLEGQVVGHPLADWKALDAWRPPDPMTKSEREDFPCATSTPSARHSRSSASPDRGAARLLRAGAGLRG